MSFINSVVVKFFYPILIISVPTIYYYLNLQGKAVTGDAGQLSSLTKLATLNLQGTKVTGCPLTLADGRVCDCKAGCS